LLVDRPIQIIGDEHNPANVVVELSGSLKWTAKGGFIEGVTFRRPKISSGSPPANDLLIVEGSGRVDVLNAVFDNDGCTGIVAKVSGNCIRKGRWNAAVLKGGEVGLDLTGGSIEMIKGAVKGNKTGGVRCGGMGSSISMLETKIERNTGPGVHILDKGEAKINKCHFSNNRIIMKKDNGCTTQCSGNVAILKKHPSVGIPGFRFVQKDGDGISSTHENGAKT
jgi:hypothetical protein